MLRSAGSLPSRARIDTQVCVIGAGPAGISLGLELAAHAVPTCILESGGHRTVEHLDRDPLYELYYTDERVSRASRVRALGGTTKVWAGRWKRFDAVDLAPRDWIAGSGWPLDPEVLRPYYERAARLAGIVESEATGAERDLLASEIVVPTTFWTQRAARRDWGRAFARELATARTLDVMLEAHVVGVAHHRGAVEIEARGPQGQQVTVHARFAVLSAGGIENARQLLLSNLGNEHDQVGRYYMDHPKGKIGVVETYRPVDISAWSGWSEDDPSYTGFRLADDVQRRERVLNSHVFLAPVFERDLARRLVRRVRRPRSSRLLAVRNYLEQAPHPDNRVLLVDDHDPHRRPRAVVRWTIGELDRATLRTFHRLLARELQRAGVGELASPLLAGGSFPDLVDASHHLGTTRMGRDPATSVVDPDCRLHEVDNVYVAGSSVFPTSGYANPTATIVALALRLADHLRSRR